MGNSGIIRDSSVSIRNFKIVEYSKATKNSVVIRQDRVSVIDSMGRMVDSPPLGFYERGFKSSKLLGFKDSKIKIELERAVLLYSNAYGEENFEHWMLDVLPKAWHAKKSEFFEDLIFILPRSPFEELTKEYLSYIGVAPSQILNIDEADITISEQIEYVSNYTHPFSIDCSGFIGDLRESLSNNTLNNENKSDSAKKDRIFLGRIELDNSGSGRYIENLQEVTKMLESEGFEFVNAGNLSLSEKYSMFSNCNMVLTEIGANCLNILMSSNVKKFIQIGHRHWPKTFYHDVFEILNPECNSKYLFFETSDPNHNPYESSKGVNVPWIVDVDRLRSEINNAH